MANFALTNLDENANSQTSEKKTQFFSFSCVDFFLKMLSFYFDTEIKTASLRVILPNLGEGNMEQKEISL